jgi:hypothetical protein
VKHLTVADKSLLVGDDAADLLVEYAKLLGQVSSADSIDLHAIGADGDEVVATFLLNSGVTLVAESTTSQLAEPDNSKAEQYMHTQILQGRERAEISADDISGREIWNTAEAE